MKVTNILSPIAKLPGVLKSPKLNIDWIKSKEVDSGVVNWAKTNEGILAKAERKGSELMCDKDIHPESLASLIWTDKTTTNDDGKIMASSWAPWEVATTGAKVAIVSLTPEVITLPDLDTATVPVTTTTATDDSASTTDNASAAANSGIYLVMGSPPSIRFFRRELAYAQLLYLAVYTVFVANLPSDYADAELTLAVLDQFLIYGPVFAAVFRRGMGGDGKPYCILQYTNAHDADLAVRQTRSPGPDGHNIAGRSVRVDYCQANRTVTAYGPPSDQLVNLMGSFGCGQWFSSGLMTMKFIYETYGAFKEAKRALGNKSGPYRFSF